MAENYWFVFCKGPPRTAQQLIPPRLFVASAVQSVPHLRQVQRGRNDAHVARRVPAGYSTIESIKANAGQFHSLPEKMNYFAFATTESATTESIVQINSEGAIRERLR